MITATQEDIRATGLIQAMAELPPGHRDRAALRDQAIEAWLPMAGRLARRYANKGETRDDLRQTASIGLIKAIDRFDPNRGSDFVSFAIPTILGELKRHFRDRAWSVRIPRRLQELHLAVVEASAELGQRLGRAPTVTDLAERLNVTDEAILEAMESAHAYRSVSLSAPLRDGDDLQLGDMFGSEEDGYHLAELRASLPPAMASLTERERRIILLRFYGNMTQTGIAEKVGISQMHVSRLLAGALAKLRTQLG